MSVRFTADFLGLFFFFFWWESYSLHIYGHATKETTSVNQSSNCLVCCLLCLALHYTCDLDSYVGLIQTEVMLCLKKMNKLGWGLVNNCLVNCLFCLTCCLFADFCVCLHPSSEGSLQLRLWMAFRLTLVVTFLGWLFACVRLIFWAVLSLLSG